MIAICIVLAILLVYILDSFTDALIAIVLLSWYAILKLCGYRIELPKDFWRNKDEN